MAYRENLPDVAVAETRQTLHKLYKLLTTVVFLLHIFFMLYLKGNPIILCDRPDLEIFG